MTTIERAITAAVEFGNWDWKSLHKRLGVDEDNDLPIAEIVIDPAFWQALGKARGWHVNSFCEPPWRFHWHRFIDHLAEGEDAESFFAELLK